MITGMNATVSNALGSLSKLIEAGVDGVFLDGVVDFGACT